MAIRLEDGDGSATIIISSLTVTLVIAAAIFGWFALRMRARRSRIADDHPGARQVQFSPSPELASAARAFAARISTSAHGTLIVHEGRLKIFVGGGEAPRINVPVDDVTDISVGETLLGVRWTRSIDFTVSSPAGPVKLPIAVLRDGNMFRSLTDAEVEAMAAQLRQEIAAFA
ncbi:hypothetical protein J7E25_09695 [Agromyces sp. ISL-38]|uniref:hypothetical protein n=1 Tax=Agromyces sp. ISL-38 TaxID=2819107 RepID=UPI001BECE51C|nr:hypothetical protein [Agromyces sp. ISL-38]MBT2499372.1 hypothetical protein [Agromyces sp. ISL-38]